MFILTIAGKEKDGAYSVPDGDGDQIWITSLRVITGLHTNKQTLE